MKKRLTALMVIACMLGGWSGASAQSSPPRLRSAEQLISYLLLCAQNLDSQISFYYTEEMDELFESTEATENILYNCGAFSWSWKRYRAQRRIDMENIVYYPGYRAARAWVMNRLDLLSGEEMQLLERAGMLVEQAMDESRTPLELEQWLHDEICRRTVYTLSPDGKSIFDTAEGVLYGGQAECDGYADAFYLLGTLAGFNVGFRYGTTVESVGNGTHLWNVIEWDGRWYHVDVTWDDPDYEGYDDMIRYRYFNVGSDMFRDHFWSEEWAVQPSAAYTDWNRFFYTCGQAGEQSGGLYCASLRDAAEYAARRREQGMSDVHVMVDGRYENGQQFNEQLKNLPLYGRWTTWTKEMGPYTLFDVLFLE